MFLYSFHDESQVKKYLTHVEKKENRRARDLANTHSHTDTHVHTRGFCQLRPSTTALVHITSPHVTPQVRLNGGSRQHPKASMQSLRPLPFEKVKGNFSSRAWRRNHEPNRTSVTEQAPAVAVKLTMQSAFLANERSPKTKYIPKGTFLFCF